MFLLILPNDGYAVFKKVSCQLSSTQQKLYQIYRELMNGQLKYTDKAQVAHTLPMQAIEQQTQFMHLLEGAEKECYEVWEIRHKWVSYREQVEKLSEIMAYWRESFSEIQTLDLQELLPNLKVFDTELDDRLTQIGRMLADESPTQVPQTIELQPNADALKKLSAFQQAVFTVYLNHLRSLEPLTTSMFNTLGDIKGYTHASTSITKKLKQPFILVPDIDRLLGSFRVLLALWICYFLLVYVNDIPGGANLVAMASASAMAVALAPQLPIKMFMPALTGFIIFTGLIFFFLMPQLSTFPGLGLLIFSVSFMICYVYAAPQKMLFKGLGIVLFLTLNNINNEQNYSFKNFVDTSLMFYIIAFALQITAFIPFSSQPERAFLRLLSRFFRCSEYLISTMQKDRHKLTRFEAWKKVFYTRELTMVPNKLAMWGRFIDTKTLSGASPEQIQALTINLQALTFCLHELLDARGGIQAESLVQELQVQALQESIRAWQMKMLATFQTLSQDPAAGNSEKFNAVLSEILDHLEIRIKETLNTTSKVQLTPQDAENFYRLLRAYRSVSEAMHLYVASMDAIHWSQWKEEKFTV